MLYWYIHKYMIKKLYTEIEDDDMFPSINIEHFNADHDSNNNPTIFDEININEIGTNQLCSDSIENRIIISQMIVLVILLI